MKFEIFTMNILAQFVLNENKKHYSILSHPDLGRHLSSNILSQNE